MSKDKISTSNEPNAKITPDKVVRETIISPIPWQPEDFFNIKEIKDKNDDFYGYGFTCKKCGYSFSMQFYDNIFNTVDPRGKSDAKMLDHLKNFHILEIVG